MLPECSSAGLQMRTCFELRNVDVCTRSCLQVRVFWPAMGRWYNGRISSYNSKTGGRPCPSLHTDYKAPRMCMDVIACADSSSASACLRRAAQGKGAVPWARS